MFLFMFLRQFHNSNAQLDLLIGELRAKLDDMGAQNLHERKRIADQEASRGRLQAPNHRDVLASTSVLKTSASSDCTP